MAGVTLMAASPALAAGFRIPEADTAALGMSNTGVAGLDNAAAGYFNPALLTSLEGTKFSTGTVFIHPSSDTTPIIGGRRLPAVSQNSHWFHPLNVHATHRYSDKFAIGVSVTNPFGLGIDYPNNWVYREDIALADIKLFNFDLSVAYKITDSLSIGVGVDYMTSTIKLIQGLPNLSAIGGAALPSVFLSGQGDGWGGRAGITYQLTDELRFGATYRSSVTIKYDGSANFMGAPGALFPDQLVTTSIKMPDVIMFGLSWDNGTTRIEFDADRTGWSSFQQLAINFAIGTPSGKQQVAPRNWSDEWALRFGAEHDYGGFKLRAGAYYDISPIPDSTLDPLLPGSDRIGVTVGLGIDLAGGKYGKIDVSYLHIFFKNRSTTTNVNGVNAAYTASADLIGVNYSFDL